MFLVQMLKLGSWSATDLNKQLHSPFSKYFKYLNLFKDEINCTTLYLTECECTHTHEVVSSLKLGVLSSKELSVNLESDWAINHIDSKVCGRDERPIQLVAQVTYFCIVSSSAPAIYFFSVLKVYHCTGFSSGKQTSPFRRKLRNWWGTLSFRFGGLISISGLKSRTLSHPPPSLWICLDQA